MKHAKHAAAVLAAALLAPAAGFIATSATAQEAVVTRPDVPTAPEPTATPEPSVEERLKFLLSGYEYFPTRADLDAVAKPEVVVATLLRFAADDAARTTLRLRAVDALGYYDSAESVEYLGELVGTKLDALPRKRLRVASLLKHHAITSLARAGKDKAVPHIAAVLAADDVQLRLTAIHALGKHGGDDGRAVLQAHRKNEKSEFVRRELQKWVTR